MALSTILGVATPNSSAEFLNPGLTIVKPGFSVSHRSSPADMLNYVAFASFHHLLGTLPFLYLYI